MTRSSKRVTRTIRRALAVGVGVAAMSGMLAACGSTPGTEAPAAKTTIRLLYATGDDTWNSVVDGIIKSFNGQSTTTIVSPDPLPAGSDYATAMRTMDATGNWPAIVDMRDTATYIKAGKLAPIPAEVTDLLAENVFAPAASGNVYTVPTGALNGELGINIVFNRTYFTEHNLSVPSTYAEFISLMEAIKANGDAPLATAAGEVWPSDQLWKPLAAPYFAQWEGGFWNSVLAGKASMEDLRAPLEKLQYITDNFVLEGWQSTQDAQTTTLLVNGNAVMATSSAGLGRLKDINKVDANFEAGMFIIPAEDGTINVMKGSVNGDAASGFAISAQAAADEAQYASAVEFLTFFYSVEAANQIEQLGWISPRSRPPTRSSATPRSPARPTSSACWRTRS